MEISDGYGLAMYLWNPFTGKHKAVRRSGVEHEFLSAEAAPSVVGFGSDARLNDYKIVRILYFPDDGGRCFGGTKPRVEIYLLRTDSWTSLECEAPALHPDNNKAVFLNENLHWCASKSGDLWEEGGYGSIISFDVAGEAFDEMAPLVELSQADTVNLIMSVAVLNDLLAVFISFQDADDFRLLSICSVWVMREYGVPRSWTKLYTFEARGEVTRFDGFTRNGELMMEIDDGERVCWNLITGQYTNFPLPTQCDWVDVVESLVSL